MHWKNAKVWVRHSAVTLCVFVFLGKTCIISSYPVCALCPFVFISWFPNPSQRFPFHSWSCHALADPIWDEFSCARDMPSWRKSTNMLSFCAKLLGGERHRNDSGKSFIKRYQKSKATFGTCLAQLSWMHDGGDECNFAASAQLPPWIDECQLTCDFQNRLFQFLRHFWKLACRSHVKFACKEAQSSSMDNPWL